VGTQVRAEEKEMKKEFAKLSRGAQERVELEYHGMKPEEFDKLMAGAKPHSPDTIRLPRRMVETLKAVAATAGENGYETLVRRWVNERLRQETRSTRKSSKKTYPKKTTVRRQIVK
jgi:hypothetical protein